MTASSCETNNIHVHTYKLVHIYKRHIIHMNASIHIAYNMIYNVFMCTYVYIYIYIHTCTFCTYMIYKFNYKWNARRWSQGYVTCIYTHTIHHAFSRIGDVPDLFTLTLCIVPDNNGVVSGTADPCNTGIFVNVMKE